MDLLRLFLILHILRIAHCGYTAAKATEIRSETVLSASYDSVARPVAQTLVKVTLSLLAIDNLELKTQKLTVAGWLTFEWEDSRLAWNKTAKDDIEHVNVQPDTVWKPELLIDNSLENLGVISDKNLHLKVKYDGTVEWEPPMIIVTHCEVDITYYPYDRQKCSIDLASWGYTYDEVRLIHLKDNVNMEDFQRHGEWDVEGTSIEVKNLTEHTSTGAVVIYPQLTFSIYLERRTDFYNLNVMMPICLMSLLISLVFIVPVDSGEKLSFVLTVLLSLSVLLTLVADSLPATSITTSVLGLYLGIVLVLAAVAALLTVLILILSHKEGRPELTCRSLSLYRIALKVTFAKNNDNSVSEFTLRKVYPKEGNDPVVDDTDSVDCVIMESEVTWQEMSVVLDRFCFVVFLITTAITNISFVTALAVGGKINDP